MTATSQSPTRKRGDNLHRGDNHHCADRLQRGPALCPPLDVPQWSRQCNRCRCPVNVEHFAVLSEDRAAGEAVTLLYCDNCVHGLETLWTYRGGGWEVLWHEQPNLRTHERQKEFRERIERARTA